MTETNTAHKLAYRVAHSFYLGLKKILGPSVRSHPRVHLLAVAFKEGVKTLIGTPGTVHKTSVHPGLSKEPERKTDPRRASENRGKLPGWLIKEWREIHAIEPQLFPDLNIQFNTVTDFIPPSMVGEHYLSLCEIYGEGISHVFLVPWLKKGGADLVTLNYVRALIDHKLGKGVVVITTENSDSPWAKKLPAEARLIEFGEKYSHLSPEEQEKLLARVLLQMAPQAVHNINSLLGYNVFIKYGKAISAGTHLFACAFCEDITPEGRSVGYPVCFLRDCFDSLTGVFFDNRNTLEKLSNIFAFEKEKLHVHYQPVDLVAKKVLPERSLNKEYLDVLWASRLDIQKRPDILIEIAKRSEHLPFRFHVHGTPVYGTTRKKAEEFVRSLNALPNVRYYGPFDGLPSLPVENYDLYLYTSQWDGLPNVLLEAIAVGLPVVASKTGGIPELIRHGETGFLIDPYDNPEGYVNALKKGLSDRAGLVTLAGNAYKLLNQRHVWSNFVGALKTAPYYAVPDSKG